MMDDEKVEIGLESLSRFRGAMLDYARDELDRLTQAAIDELRSRHAEGVFGGNLHPRHRWDEYCWNLWDHEDPYAMPLIIPDSEGLDDVMVGAILALVNKLPTNAQVALSALAFWDDTSIDEDEWLGCISIDGILKIAVEAVNERAARRNLDLIGPERANAISLEIEAVGFVWSALDSGGMTADILDDYSDAMIDPNADLKPMAEDVITQFFAMWEEDEDGPTGQSFLEHFEPDLRAMLKDKDVLPSLTEMRRELLEKLDA
jgi:hypothetical protein